MAQAGRYPGSASDPRLRKAADQLAVDPECGRNQRAKIYCSPAPPALVQHCPSYRQTQFLDGFPDNIRDSLGPVKSGVGDNWRNPVQQPRRDSGIVGRAVLPGPIQSELRTQRR